MKNFIKINKQLSEKITFSKPGNYIVFFENLSGKYIFEIVSPNVNLEVYGLYVGKKNNKFQIETVQHHQSPSSTSNLLIKGVFYDWTKFNYQGLIRIENKAQKSHAYQKNQNLILSPNVFVESKPYLEILANDVFCTHGSTTGKLNKDQLFYLKTRGLNEKEAENLLVEGFIREIEEKIKQKIPNFQLLSETNLC